MKLLDTSFLVDYLRGHPSAGEYVTDHDGEAFVGSAVAFYELYHGAVKVGRPVEDVDRDLQWVDREPFGFKHGQEAARIREELESSGERIEHSDMVLAGVARSLGAPVVTANAEHFERVSGIVVENHRELY
ncbi:PIN domain-containing protein [Halobium salinum]|uniref:PIN domain-containing protein n=1 Tax=Halobium salinum TaxID=1364940 RepID=A0ABD5P7J2_9EURY|nr:PIN domain-containing protein [Halobium salinum]